MGTLQKMRDFTINGGDFLIKRAKEFFDIGTVEGKARAIAFLYPYADALTSEVQRGAFLDLASRELGANPISIRADYEAAKRGLQVSSFKGGCSGFRRAGRDWSRERADGRSRFHGGRSAQRGSIRGYPLGHQTRGS